MKNNFLIGGVVGVLIIGLVYFLSGDISSDKKINDLDNLEGEEIISDLNKEEDEEINSNETGEYSLLPFSVTTPSYVSLLDWPPQLQVVEKEDDDFVCTKAGAVVDRAGLTEPRIIDGSEFCVTEIAEGAAGSEYRQFAYAFSSPSLNKVFIYTFSARLVQCLNYDEPEATICAEDQASFDPDEIAAKFLKYTNPAI